MHVPAAAVVGAGVAAVVGVEHIGLAIAVHLHPMAGWSHDGVAVTEHMAPPSALHLFIASVLARLSATPLSAELPVPVYVGQVAVAACCSVFCCCWATNTVKGTAAAMISMTNAEMVLEWPGV